MTKMATWRDYIKVALKDKYVEDVAIVGLYDNRAVWASKPGGFLAAITPGEVELLVGKDRASLLHSGVTVGGQKAAVIQDCMFGSDINIHFVDLRMKGKESFSLSVAQTNKALVFLLGKLGVPGGIVSKKAYDMAKYLSEKGS